jgi:hypothetical protein
MQTLNVEIVRDGMPILRFDSPAVPRVGEMIGIQIGGMTQYTKIAEVSWVFSEAKTLTVKVGI